MPQRTYECVLATSRCKGENGLLEGRMGGITYLKNRAMMAFPTGNA